MAGSDQEGADQSTLDEETSSTSDGQQLESAREDAAGDSSHNQESTEESGQRSIRDMLDDEGEASVFVNRDLVEPDTIIDEG
jgi:cell division control protein 6